MDGKMIALIVVVVIVMIVAFVIGIYNKLVTLRTRVEEAWSDITIQLKYRADLIPNLVNTVKGYAKHENETFTMVTEARAGIMSAKTVEETAAAEGQMQMALKSLFAVAESYPELKANENFLQLQTQLEDTEHKIQAARRFYNAGVKDYNIQIAVFPANIIAGMFKFEKREFFEVEDRAKIEEAPEVQF